MKIISWNVNGIRAWYKKGQQDFIKNQNPDIFCVQETKAHLEQVPPQVQSLNYPYYDWSSAYRKGYSGTATFSRQAAQSVKKGIGIEAYDREGRFVISTYKKFEIYNIYFPNGGANEERHQYKQDFLKALNTYLQKRLKENPSILVLGDYNIAYLDIDVYDPQKLKGESGFLPEEKEWFQSFFNLGFVDIFRHFYPQKKEVFSWWSYREGARPFNRGWRIDHICVSTALLAQIKKVSILHEVGGSDHCPVLIEL